MTISNIARTGSALLLIFVCAVAVMPKAQADTNTDLSAQIAALLAQVSSMQAQLQANGGASSATSVVASSNGSSCVPPVVTRNLTQGSSGSEVSSLQTYLALDPSIYPEALVTGFYGAATERAVERWQTRYGVISSGSPSTTGFGAVGPRTRALLANGCGSGNTGSGNGGTTSVSGSGSTGVGSTSVNANATDDASINNDVAGLDSSISAMNNANANSDQ